ncbi:MAG: MFS transporter [Candidatus Bathyarchaeota archaeon]|nr:MFS transporter [Candidatus Bathyarchaeota archaeon]
MTKDEGEFKNVVRLGLVSFFTDVSSEMVFSILPMFILGLPGGSVATLGLIEGIAEALSYMLRAVSGIMSDKFRKRKVFIIVGYGISNIAKPFFAAASTVAHALVIRVTDRVGKGIRTAPRDALISDSVSEARRGEAFGLHRTLDQTGAIIGPMMATAVMVFLGWTVRDVFWLSLLPGSIALLIILFGVKEIIGGEGGEFRFLEGLQDVVRGRFLRLICFVGLFSLGAFNFSFILLNAREMGVGDALIPVVYAVVNVTHTIIAIPAGRLSDRIGKEKVLVAGYGVFLVTTLFLALIPGSVASAYFIAAVFGVYMGIVETVQRALIPGYVDSSLRGTAYGVYYLVVGSAFFVSNTLVGILWQNQGLWASSIYSGALASFAILGLMVFIRE